MSDTDIRVQRTKKALYQALIELALKEGYEAVTVRSIAKRAGVGFKTFYRHYKDKDDLLFTVSRTFSEAFFSLVAPPTSWEAIEGNALIILKIAEQHVDLLKVIFRSPARDKLTEPMIAYTRAEGNAIYNLSKTHSQQSDNTVPNDIVVYHFTTSTFQLVQWWVENDMPYPVETMATYINRLVVKPIWNLNKPST